MPLPLGNEVCVAYFHMPKKPWKSDSPTKRGSATARAEKSIIISDVNDKERKRLVETSAGTVEFRQGMAHLPNDARGRDIVAEYKTMALDPKGVAVARDRPTRWRDPIHRRFWGSWPEMPWKDDDAEPS